MRSIRAFLFLSLTMMIVACNVSYSDNINSTWRMTERFDVYQNYADLKVNANGEQAYWAEVELKVRGKDEDKSTIRITVYEGFPPDLNNPVTKFEFKFGNDSFTVVENTVFADQLIESSNSNISMDFVGYDIFKDGGNPDEGTSGDDFTYVNSDISLYLNGAIFAEIEIQGIR